ncbi:tryptophan 7-halogenase [Actinoallomurus iriomotensis]|uniref:FAD-binding protein n=1 Tax=Actinoallomurus iriomotensis TaxID=478107 RepID=A0A9W6RS88_9ACTN|nr:tryptophan 7-halogenase [Actinoallomurus iriomotensis]GLY81596.1 FAD-binding protein [Actinoallomurus iriomotensis]
MTASPTEVFDVVVVGGGPAGSTVATLAAQAGHRVLVLERETFPRYQIGESLLPATVHGVCRMLGVADEIAEAGFVRKRGGTFRWGASDEPWTFTFATSRRMAGPTSHAYQVERMKFDDILLRNAARKGAEVRQGHTVTGLVEDDDAVRGVRFTDPSGDERQADARFVIDASGHTSRVRKGVRGERQYSEFFQNIALFGYFEGGRRLPAPNAGNIFCAAFSDGWFWYIPLSAELTSVGAVVKREMAARVQGDPEQALMALITDCPEMADFLKDAKRVTTGPYGQIRTRKDYSYRNTAFWRPGMALVGDAACFIDPVFSSGVHLATYSGLLAARSINSVLDGGMEEARAFAEFEARYRREFGLFYQFLISFYQMHVDEQSYFWAAKKVTNCPDSEIEAFVDLVGGVASGENALVSRSARERVAGAAREFGDAVDRIAGRPDGEVGAVGRRPFVPGLMDEGSRLQSRAALGELAEEAPLSPGGLVPSSDGLRWEEPPSSSSTTVSPA